MNIYRFCSTLEGQRDKEYKSEGEKEREILSDIYIYNGYR